MKIYFKRIATAISLAFLFSVNAFSCENIVNFNSDEGLKILERAKFKNDFYQLANFYQPQINPLYCSAASGTIVLNALNYGDIPSQKEAEVTKPKSLVDGKIEYHLYSQATFFNEKTDAIKNRKIIQMILPKTVKSGEEIYDPGLDLQDFAKILSKIYKLKAKVIYAEKNDEKSVSKFRENLKKILADKTHFIIANFDGQILGQKTRGHLSPLAAFDEEKDLVLIFDVALHKNQWYFASVESLYKAMNTKDGESFRGYIIVSK